MKWAEFVNDYLTFSRRERIGIIALLVILLIIFLLPKIIRNEQNLTHGVDTSWISTAKNLEIKDSIRNPETSTATAGDDGYLHQYDRSVTNSSQPGSLFYFDPNILEEAGWRKLGLKDKTIHTIQNYLSKGGHFYKPEDLKKIYGLHPNDYFRLEPYIKIENKRVDNSPQEYSKKEVQPTKSASKIIDINTADTSMFISLPGIGGKLAARIVNFRDRLGGFYSIDQIAETYGLPDSTFQKIKQYLRLEDATVKKININTATVDELKVHPYIKYSIANPIVAYRNEHGPFSKIEDIKKVMAVTDDIYNKIAPYLTTQ